MPDEKPRDPKVVSKEWGFSDLGAEERVSHCVIRFEPERGVLYVGSTKTGTTLVRIQGIVPNSTLMGPTGLPAMLDIFSGYPFQGR